MLNLSELTDKVRALAIEAGDFIREERKKFHREAIEKKHAHDYVSCNHSIFRLDTHVP